MKKYDRKWKDIQSNEYEANRRKEKKIRMKWKTWRINKDMEEKKEEEEEEEELFNILPQYFFIYHDKNCDQNKSDEKAIVSLSLSLSLSLSHTLYMRE